jgi:hypothetical protein
MQLKNLGFSLGLLLMNGFVRDTSAFNAQDDWKWCAKRRSPSIPRADSSGGHVPSILRDKLAAMSQMIRITIAMISSFNQFPSSPFSGDKCQSISFAKFGDCSRLWSQDRDLKTRTPNVPQRGCLSRCFSASTSKRIFINLYNICKSLLYFVPIHQNLKITA